MATPIKHLAAGLAALTLAGTAAAQPETVRSTTTAVQKATAVMNTNIVIQDGSTVGKITDFVISEGGCIEYVVVAYDGKFVLVPYQSLRLDSTKHLVQISLTQAQWREIPTFTGSNWPLADQQYIGKVRTVFGVRESGYRGDRRDGDRRPINRVEDQQPQRRDVENPNRPGAPPPSVPPVTRPPETNRPPPPNTDRPRENPVTPTPTIAPPGKQQQPAPPNSNPPAA
jgi:hypothetical protein